MGLREADDVPIWEYATSCGVVIITKDEDFSNRKAIRRGEPKVVWVRVGNCSNRALLEWFAPLFASVAERLSQGEEFIELI